MQPDQLRREVNRLYWETDTPVTRLSDELGVSRGTFYNHLDPLPASGKCRGCGAPLFFRTRSSREAGEAQCEACGNEQMVQPTESGGARDARKPRTMGVAGRARADASATTGGKGVTPPRFAFLAADDDDRLRTQLVAVAVGAAVLGLGVLYFSRRR